MIADLTIAYSKQLPHEEQGDADVLKHCSDVTARNVPRCAANVLPELIECFLAETH